MTFPLAELLARTPTGDTRVAFGAEGDRTAADLHRDVHALAGRLGADDGARWLVDTEDGYRVAVAMLAAGVTGSRISLPPNLQPGTIEELAAGCACVLSDQARAAGPLQGLDPLDPGQAAERAAAPATIERERPLVELFTSGSSGPGKRVVKSLQHLEDEVVTLERELGARLPASHVVLATASPRHLYGLLFRVLWPLAQGRPFLRTSLLLPDELVQKIAAAGAPVALVSTPAHLRHLVACPRLASVAGSVAAVFSSGGPLEESVARSLERILGHAPIEIFGSTETGGVGYRQGSAAQPQPPWRTMSSVRIATEDDSRLVVTSPFVTAPEGDVHAPSTWTMGDRVEIDGGGFRLAGRADRIVKIGEKTFSLPAIEEALLTHSWIDAVAVAAYRDKTGTRLGAIVVLTPDARIELARRGRRFGAAELGEHLARTWDRLALPRRWRFCKALPFDERGKLSAAAVESCLAAAPEPVLGPVVIDEKIEGTLLVRRIVVPRDLACLEGHYEGFPLVQGVAQIDWVMNALSDLVGSPAAARRMEAIKFKDVLRPAQELTLRVELEQAARRAAFTLADGERVFSSGRIELAETGSVQ
ncbi:MAG TPA: AMP-binding protein [Candidatus Binatia bacterium]|nr:AMP-binding protein [Candidatus Binatia bacterium]